MHWVSTNIDRPVQEVCDEVPPPGIVALRTHAKWAVVRDLNAALGKGGPVSTPCRGSLEQPLGVLIPIAYSLTWIVAMKTNSNPLADPSKDIANERPVWVVP